MRLEKFEMIKEWLKRFLILSCVLIIVESCVNKINTSQKNNQQIRLVTIEKYNQQSVDSINWKEEVYTGAEYLEKMLRDKGGNLVILAGNNRKKTEYIARSVEAGFNVLSDKPMAINAANFEQLQNAFTLAKKNKVLLYDIMTERFEITNMLQKKLADLEPVFGEFIKGSFDDPAIQKGSVHHFFKYVSGSPLVRPAWYFDAEQAGEGIVDVTTHLVDLVQWQCFPEVALDYKKDIQVLSGRRWATDLGLPDFYKVTRLDSLPEYLKKYIQNNQLSVYSNGEINYTIKGIHTRISVQWNFEAPEGTGDTHFSVLRGTKANLVIRQGKEEGYKPVLYIEPSGANSSYETDLFESLKKIQEEFSGVQLKKISKGWVVEIPEKYKTGHESHFAEVMKNYLQYLKKGRLPAWEVPDMLAKYYITTTALRLAISK